MADWQAIKTEYITTDTSYRKLAEKYGVSRVQIGNVGRDEGWVELRRQYLDETLTKTVDAISEQEVDRAKRIKTVADKLLNKIEAIVDAVEPLDMPAKSIRALTAAVKDLKEIQSIKSALDEQEQRARIEKLRKDAAGDEDNKQQTVTVIMGGDAEKYAD